MRGILPFLLIALFLAAVLSIFASSRPDGLERVAQTLGFSDETAKEPVVAAPLPDYTVPGLGESKLSTSIAGIIGALVCFFLPFGLYLLRKK